MKLERMINIAHESYNITVKQEDIDSLYRKIVNNKKLQKVFYEEANTQSNMRQAKKNLTKEVFRVDNLDEKKAKEQLFMIIANHFLELELADVDLHNINILNIGAGMPLFDEYLRSTYVSSVTSLDLHPTIKELSLLENEKSYVIGDATKLPLEDNSFNLIISNASMPHLFTLPPESDAPEKAIEQFLEEDYSTDIMEQNIAAVFNEGYRCLKSGGEIRFASLEENFYLQPDVEVLFDEGSTMNLEKINMYQNKRVAIIKKALNTFTLEHRVLSVYKDTGLIVIKKL